MSTVSLTMKCPFTSYTQTKGAQASLSFSGDAVSVYGGVSFDHGNYTVSLDGDTKQLDGGTARTYHAQVK